MSETFTDKLKLSKRDTGDLNWGAGHNANLDLLDTHSQQETLRPPRTLQANLGSGAVGAQLLGSTVYFYKVTTINSAGETTENTIPSVLEVSISQPVSPLPVVLQWETVKGATGYRIYKSTITGQEKFLAEVSGESTANYTDTGNTATTLTSVPSQNTARASVKKIVAGSGISISPPDGTGDVTIQSNTTGGVSTLRKTGNPTGLSGDVSLEQGTGISLSQDTPNEKIVVANAGVTGVRKNGDPNPLTGDVKLEAGTNISLTQDTPNNKVVIASTAVGGVTSLKKTGSGTSLTGDVSLEQGTGIALTQDDPNNKINIANAGVTGLRKLGDPSALAGDVKLEAGTNISLTQDVPNNKITIAATGGGVTAYQTQVVAAPTGVAATDTANIAAALSAAGTAGGGVVQLREGSYTINGTLTIPAKVTLQGMGRDATTILCDPSMGAVNTIATSGNSQGLRDLKIDENQSNRAGGNPFVGIFLSGTNPLVENCQFVRNKSSGSFIFLGTGGEMRNCIITNNGNGLSTAIVQGGTLIDNCDITMSQNNGSVNDFFQSPGQIINCRLVRSTGTLAGAGIRLQSGSQIAIGNLISVGSGNNAIIISSGTTACIANGNYCGTAKITLEANVNSAIVVGNALAVITNNSGTGTNQIANNS